MENHRPVLLTDVTGRDGFQMENEWIPTETKIRVINDLIKAGIKRIEATSFVSPKAVPQLKDAREVLDNIDKRETSIAVLVPNVKGAELALSANVDEINVVMSVSETHNLKNIRKKVHESIDEIKVMNELVKKDSKIINVGLATTFGCPFEGLFSVTKVAQVIEQLKGNKVDSFSLSDTTGMANPKQVFDFVKYLSERFPNETFTLHLHNTRGMGLANIVAGYQAGVNSFDASLGGIGGCPFAPGATGNVCLEDAVHMFEQMGIPTGIDVNQLIKQSKQLEKMLGYTLSGQLMKSGQATEIVKA